MLKNGSKHPHADRAYRQHKRNQGPGMSVYIGLVILAVVAVIVVVYALDR